MTQDPSAGGSRLRSKRSSIRRTSEVEVNRIPFDKRFVTLADQECSLVGFGGNVHLSQTDRIGLDRRDAQSVYWFSNHQVQADTFHPSFILEDWNHFLSFMLKIHIDGIYLYLISRDSHHEAGITHATYLLVSSNLFERGRNLPSWIRPRERTSLLILSCERPHWYILSRASRSSLIVVKSWFVGTNPVLLCIDNSSCSCNEMRLVLTSEEQ